MSDDSTPSLRSVPIDTWIEVVYPAERGLIGLRGDIEPFSWDHTEPPVRIDGDSHLFRIPMMAPGELAELKVVRGDDEWANGRNYIVHPGDHVRIEPYFDREMPRLEEGIVVESKDSERPSLTIDVLLPPGYDEQSNKRYPVAYALDGQSLWTHSSDPFGVWSLDATLASLFEVGAVDEIIIVGIHTSEERIARLSPVADPEYGGGRGPETLAAIIEDVKPYIESNYRVREGRENTAILGSSMGGLFAFFAAWTRPDIFGKAACLSSSFWWNKRWAVRLVQNADAPKLRANFYIDSGAAPNRMDHEARLRDGYHHTRSMYRALSGAGLELGSQVHRLVFPGHVHNADSWASRIALPLQLLFPVMPQTVDPSLIG